MPRKRLTGTVVSDQMEKTVVVEVERLYKHPRYGKWLRKRKKFYADCQEKPEVGTEVTIEESRPLSKLKRWRMVE